MNSTKTKKKKKKMKTSDSITYRRSSCTDRVSSFSENKLNKTFQITPGLQRRVATGAFAEVARLLGVVRLNREREDFTDGVDAGKPFSGSPRS